MMQTPATLSGRRPTPTLPGAPPRPRVVNAESRKPRNDLARALPWIAGLSVALRVRSARPSVRRSAQKGHKQAGLAKPYELDVMKEVDLYTVSQRLQNPSLYSAWTLLGDLLTTSVAGPLLAVLFFGVLQPDWYRHMPETDAGFIFPEFFHGAVYTVCWLLGGLGLGAFEEKATNSKNLLETIQRTALAALSTVWLASTAWLILRTGGWLEGSYALLGYAPSTPILPTFRDFFIDLQFEAWCLVAWRLTLAVWAAEQEEPPPTVEEGDEEADLEESEELEDSKVISAKLFLGDMIISGVMVPSLVIVALVQTGVYTPQWTQTWDMADYGAARAIFAHGSVLTSAWLAGAFFAKAYGPASMRRTDLAKELKRIWTAGAVAAVLLAAYACLQSIFLDAADDYVTAFDAARKFQKITFDLICDVELGAICITTWRLYYAGYI